MKNKKVFVSGCFDLLHSGHIAFLKKAAEYGDVYVGLGSDATIKELKGRETIVSEQERLYMLEAVRYVKQVFVNRGKGLIDFKEEVRQLQPDIFIVNEDGFSPAKEELCRELDIELIVLQRKPDKGLISRSTTKFNNSNICSLPYRIDIAGTWIDQAFVSKYFPGWAITISIEPVVEYNERCGMATSTRNAAKKIWPNRLPLDKPEKLAQILFKFENEPGSDYISGAQDSLGICVPALSRHYYRGANWPEKIETIDTEEILNWLEERIFLVLLWPRPNNYQLFKETHITYQNVKKLANASEKCWQAIQKKDFDEFSTAIIDSFNAQTTLFPAMLNPKIEGIIKKYKSKANAWKLAGAGGGGYLILFSEKPIEDSMSVKIRRRGTGL